MPSPEVIIDLVDGVTATDHIQQGIAVTVPATVRYLTGSTMPARMQCAIDAVYSLVGVGTACPGITKASYLEQVVPESLDGDTAKVRLIYKGYPIRRVDVRTSLNMIEGNEDIHGNIISVSYTYPKTYTKDIRKAGQVWPQGGLVPRPVPETVLTFHVIFTGSWEVMYNFATDYVGMVNSGTWLDSGDDGQWLCEAVQASTRESGMMYEAQVTFHKRPIGWQPLVVFINPDDGKPPANLVKGVGYKKVDIYRTGTLPDLADLEP